MPHRRRHRRGRAVAVLAGACLSLLAGACAPKAPQGQVLAVVNGREITELDLTSEARALGAAKADPRALLQQVVARTLLAQSAHERKLDVYPAYPSDVERLREKLLADTLLAADFKPASKPADTEVQRFIAANPQMFAARQRVKVDLIRYTLHSPSRALEDADSMVAALYWLKTMDVKYDRADQTVDTATVPPEVAQTMAATPVGKFFSARRGDTVFCGVIEARTPLVMPPPQQAQAAGQMLSVAANQAQLTRIVDGLRAKAKITYKQGYELAAPPAADAAKP